MDVKWLSREHGLLFPDLLENNAGILPAVISVMNIEGEEILRGRTINERVVDRLRKKFPDGIDNVVFLIVDGLGAAKLKEMGGMIWENIDPEKGEGLIAHSSFPTMTTTNMTSILFGQPPGRHGFVGYNIYNESLKTVFNGINGRFIFNGEERSIRGMSQDKFVRGKPLSALLSEKVNLKLYVPSQQEREGFLDLILSGVDIINYDDPEKLLGKIIGALSSGETHHFLAAYIGVIDYLGHNFGPNSKECEGAIKQLESLIEVITNHPKVKRGNTLVILTSDHGQSAVNHSKSIWLTREQVEEYQEQGVILSSSGRVLHAYAKEKKYIDRAREILEELGGDNALVIDQSTAMKMTGDIQGIWKERLGDYLLLCKDEILIDVPEVVPLHGFSPKLLGQHGSTTVNELFIPVAIWGGKKK